MRFVQRTSLFDSPVLASLVQPNAEKALPWSTHDGNLAENSLTRDGRRNTGNEFLLVKYTVFLYRMLYRANALSNGTNLLKSRDVPTVDRLTTLLSLRARATVCRTIFDRVLLRPRSPPSVLLNDDLAMTGRRTTPPAIPIGRVKLFMGLKTSVWFTQFNADASGPGLGIYFLAIDVMGTRGGEREGGRGIMRGRASNTNE